MGRRQRLLRVGGWDRVTLMCLQCCCCSSLFASVIHAGVAADVAAQEAAAEQAEIANALGKTDDAAAATATAAAAAASPPKIGLFGKLKALVRLNALVPACGYESHP